MNRSLCGPKPRKMTLWVLTAAAVWVVFLFAVHSHMKVRIIKHRVMNSTSRDTLAREA